MFVLRLCKIVRPVQSSCTTTYVATWFEYPARPSLRFVEREGIRMNARQEEVTIAVTRRAARSCLRTLRRESENKEPYPCPRVCSGIYALHVFAGVTSLIPKDKWFLGKSWSNRRFR